MNNKVKKMGWKFEDMVWKECIRLESSIIHEVNFIINNGYLADVKIQHVSEDYIGLCADTYHYDYIDQLIKSLKQHKARTLEYINMLTNKRTDIINPENSMPTKLRDVSVKTERGTIVGRINCYYKLDNKTKKDCGLMLQIYILKNE